MFGVFSSYAKIGSVFILLSFREVDFVSVICLVALLQLT